MTPPFEPFPKIARLSRDIVVTEKIDGTNAQIFIDDLGQTIYTGSRNKWITPEDDNAGFARWAKANAEELLQLGPGAHFGEWWGAGIQRRYGLTEKRFSLFNVHRWGPDATRPKCCGVVPTLYTGPFDLMKIEGIVEDLRQKGSVAAPGFMKPEGIIVYHTASQTLFKKTLEDDASPKSVARSA
jgi:hypothetical protein